MFVSFYVFPMDDIFLMFLPPFAMFYMVFCKDFPTFLQPNKTQGRQ